MTLKELRDHINSTPTTLDNYEVKVWLPGSTITIGKMSRDGLRLYRGKLMLEGNVDSGSALS